MSFMHIAIGAIGIGIILIIGFLVLAHVRHLMPTEEEIGNDTNFTESLENSQAVVIAGFGLLSVGIIILAAFAIVNLFK